MKTITKIVSNKLYHSFICPECDTHNKITGTLKIAIDTKFTCNKCGVVSQVVDIIGQEISIEVEVELQMPIILKTRKLIDNPKIIDTLKEIKKIKNNGIIHTNVDTDFTWNCSECNYIMYELMATNGERTKCESCGAIHTIKINETT